MKFGYCSEMSQTETVIKTIQDRIDAGTLLPGGDLDESQIAQELGMSRTPVREALIRLETLGLIVRHPRRGAQVFRPDAGQFLQILEIHAQLETQAAGLAARRISDQGKQSLIKANAECLQHFERYGEDEPAAYYKCNVRFHGVIVESVGNHFLEQMVKTTARKLMAYYRVRYQFPGAIPVSVKEHQQITDLILAKDSAGAERAMRMHFDYGLDVISDLLATVG